MNSALLSIILADLLRLVFNSDGGVVGIVIRNVERYDLEKIKLMELEAEHPFCLRPCHSRSKEN